MALTTGTNTRHQRESLLAQGYEVVSTPVTATFSGLGTGLIPPGIAFVAVTSPGATNVVRLPELGDIAVAYAVEGWVGANGFELRTALNSNETINNVEADGPVEAAIPANTYFRAVHVEAGRWILTAWDQLGAPLAPIVPD